MSATHCQFCGAALETIVALCPFCGSAVVLGDRYEIRAVLGRGGMSEVFLAYDRRLANEVALKRISPQLGASQELRDSLTKEARIMARLSDSSIVRLFDLNEFEGDLYLILEYVCGPSLREMLRAGYRASPLELARILGQICQGLTVAHGQGVIHRDLKPGNLMIALQGAEHEAFVASRKLPANLSHAYVKITDFGIAKAIADANVTLTNAFSGTPGYMAPEQFRGETPSPETDVYALGVITCELLTGKLPTHPLGTLPGVHPAVAQVVAKALSQVRENRFATAAAFYDGLCNGIEGRPPQQRVLRPAASRKPLLMVIGAVGAVIAVIVFIGVLTSGTQSRRVKTTVFQVPKRELPTPIEWRSIPRVTEVPPVVEEARGIVPESGLTGPLHPKIQWKVLLDGAISMRVGGIATDGTVYLTDLSGKLAAVRDGKVLWGFKLATMAMSSAHLDQQGRVWFHAMDTAYCFNRDGQGGRLPLSIHEPDERSGSLYRCVMNHELWAPGWKKDLDGNCTTGDPKVRRSGPMFLGTDVPEILAMNRNGEMAWKYTPPCEPKHLLLTGPEQMVFACEDDNTLHGMTGQNATWSVKADGHLYTDFLADSNGTVYYGDYGRDSGVTHLHAIDAQGTNRWTVNLEGASLSSLTLGLQHQLIVGSTGLYGRLLGIAD